MLRRAVLLLFVIMFGAAPALYANSISVALNGTVAGSFTINGTTYDLSPYGGTANGVPAMLICLDVNAHIPAGSNWMAGSTALTNVANNYSNTIQKNGTIYLEMAYLAIQMFSNLAAGKVGQATADQFAIWSFTGGPDPFAVSNPPFSTTALDAQALAAVQGGFTVSGWQILTPSAGQIGQEMLLMPSTVPEPASLLLVSSGLLGLAAVRRFRRRK